MNRFQQIVTVFSGRLPSCDQARFLADERVSTRIGERGIHWVDLSEGEISVSGHYSSDGLYGLNVRTEAEEVYVTDVSLISPTTDQLELADRVLNHHMLFRLKN